MNIILSNIKYKMRYQISWVAWYLLAYLIIMIPLFYILIKTSVIDSDEGSLVYRIWGITIFQFAITMKFKEDFDFFLTLSNTRNNIFQSLLGAAFGFSVLFSGLIILEKLAVDYLNSVLGLQNFADPFHFFSPYVTDNLFLTYFYFLMLCVCCSTFGILMGSLFYRFGKKFTLAFWLFFTAIPIVVFPLILVPFYRSGQLRQSFSVMGEFLREFDIMAGSGYLFLLAIVFGIAAYMNIIKLPQK